LGAMVPQAAAVLIAAHGILRPSPRPRPSQQQQQQQQQLSALSTTTAATAESFLNAAAPSVSSTSTSSSTVSSSTGTTTPMPTSVQTDRKASLQGPETTHQTSAAFSRPAHQHQQSHGRLPLCLFVTAAAFVHLNKVCLLGGKSRARAVNEACSCLNIKLILCHTSNQI
jgi:hypothetical protein